jgi:lipopolysaccharide transport system permease protein
VVSYALQAWMYATPVVYSATIVRDRWPLLYEWVYRLNPMFWVVQGFRWSVLGKGEAPGASMLPAVSIILLMLITGAHVFHRTERTVVDLL